MIPSECTHTYTHIQAHTYKAQTHNDEEREISSTPTFDHRRFNVKNKFTEQIHFEEQIEVKDLID